jgi:hypothetical protein
MSSPDSALSVYFGDELDAHPKSRDYEFVAQVSRLKLYLAQIRPVAFARS